MAGNLRLFHHRPMHWRSASALKRASASGCQHIITRQMRDNARQCHAYSKLPNLAQRLGVYRASMVIAMMRQELNQTRWDISKHNAKAYISLAIVVALYALVGYLEHGV